MRIRIFCDEIGSDWGIFLEAIPPEVYDGEPPEYREEFEAALDALVNRLNAGLALIGESGRVSIERTEN